MFESGFYDDKDLADAGFKSIGKNVLIAKNCTIINPDNISIGDNVRIDGYCTLVAGTELTISIGSYVHIGSYSFLSGAKGIILEDFSALSQCVKIYTQSDDYTGATLTNPTVPSKYKNVNSGAVVIREHALLGSGCVVLPDTEIGRGAAVGALSLVTLDLNEWFVYFGNPIRKLKPRLKDLLKLEIKFKEDLKNEKQD